MIASRLWALTSLRRDSASTLASASGSGGRSASARSRRRRTNLGCERGMLGGRPSRSRDRSLEPEIVSVVHCFHAMPPQQSPISTGGQAPSPNANHSRKTSDTFSWLVSSFGRYSQRYGLPVPETGLSAKVRLIALDLDGTTLTSERRIHPRNAGAIARARAAGATVVLASGRIRPSMAPFARELGLGAGPLICSNGAHIVDADGSNLAVEYLGAQARNTIIDYALSQGFHLNGYTTDQMFYLDESPWLELYRTRAKTIPTERIGLEAMRALDAIKLMIIAEPGKIKELATRGHA